MVSAVYPSNVEGDTTEQNSSLYVADYTVERGFWIYFSWEVAGLLRLNLSISGRYTF